jgi:hypothetical protein
MAAQLDHFARVTVEPLSTLRHYEAKMIGGYAGDPNAIQRVHVPLKMDFQLCGVPSA